MEKNVQALYSGKDYLEKCMIFQIFKTPGLSINTYLVGDPHSKRAVVIDPVRHVDPYIQFAKENGLEITDIAETHVHGDFVSGSKELKHRLKGKSSIHCSAMGGTEWTPHYADYPVKNNDQIDLGKIRLQALHTPGHTPEHISWLLLEKNIAFTGDFLFVGGVGRPDLLGKEEMESLAKQLYHSLFQVISDLPDSMKIFPAHGAGSICGKGISNSTSSTLGEERQRNPAFVKKPINQWIKELQEDISSAPPNFRRLKRINVVGPSLLSETIKGDKQNLVIDLREPETFAFAHIKGSLNIPLGDSFCNWAGSVLDEDVDLVLVAENQEQLSEGVRNLQLIGFDRIEKQFVWDKLSEEDFQMGSLPLVTAEELSDYMTKKEKSSFYILDVRTPSEWKAGHIAGAHHLELAKFLGEINQVPRDKSIFVTCGRGYRGSIAASFLKQKGYNDVANIRGGMTAWNKAKYKTV